MEGGFLDKTTGRPCFRWAMPHALAHACSSPTSPAQRESEREAEYIESWHHFEFSACNRPSTGGRDLFRGEGNDERGGFCETRLQVLDTSELGLRACQGEASE